MEESKDIFKFLDEVRKTGISDDQMYSKVSFFLEQKARDTATPYRGYFELTPFCNLDCKMCYVHLSEEQARGRKLLSADIWTSLMGQAIEAGMTRAILTGGECLTYPEFDKLYLYLKEKGIMVTVKTNGILLDAGWIDFFKNHNPRAIHISLYGHTDEIYENVTGYPAFSVVLENIRKAKKANLPISIMITPNYYMGDAIKETIRFARNLDIPYFINSTLMSPRQDTQKKKKQYDLTTDQCIDILLYNSVLSGVIPQERELVPEESNEENRYELSGIRCGAGKSGFSIRWDGSMCPCLSMDSVTSNPLTIGFSAAWERINNEASVFPAFVKCEKCTYSQECTYCAAENEKLGSRFLLNNIWCQRTRKMVESGLTSSCQRCEEDSNT